MTRKISIAVQPQYFDDFIDVIENMGYSISGVMEGGWCLWVDVVKWKSVDDKPTCLNRDELTDDDLEIISTVKRELSILTLK